MPTKVTVVTKAPAKTTTTKAPAPVNPARALKVLKAFTVAWDDPDVLAKIATAFDKHDKVAVTVQGDKALDRKQQQRVQSIGYRRGFNLNLATAVTDTHVVACAKNPSLPKSDVTAPAVPRAPKAAPAKTSGTKTSGAKKVVADPKAKAAVDKAAKVVADEKGKTRTRRASVKRPTDAKALYDATFGKADQEKAEKLAAKEAEAAADTTPHDIVIDGVTVLTVVTPDTDSKEDLITAGVTQVAAALLALDPPDPEAGLRVGVRGFDPVIETNYGSTVARFKDRDIAVAVLAQVDAIRAETV